MKIINWENGFKNTIGFRINSDSLPYTEFLKGCKNCNQVTMPINCIDRQILGNCMQSLCECSICGMPLILHDYQFNSIKFFVQTLNK